MEIIEMLYKLLPLVQGFIYPNEIELHWGLLIVLYPYITGLVAGAFILASLARVFNVSEVKPTYRLSLLTALAFLLVATLPLLAHLGHPERAFEIFFTPKLDSAMAMFGFVYAWYLMAVLLLEIWFDYRADFVMWSKTERGLKKWFYKILTLGVNNISAGALELDEKIGRAITVIGIPSAFLLHGYVGFIFGSVKANPWWSTPLMPIIFLMSAMVSGIAAVMLIYMVTQWLRRKIIDMKCLDTIGLYLFNIFVIDFSLEMLDLIHRIYEAEESFDIISLMMRSNLFWTQFVGQILVGTLVPISLLGISFFFSAKPGARKKLYFISSILTLLGIFAMRWNVVVGGQLFSKSFLGFTTYKLNLIGAEAYIAAAIAVLPLFILAALLYLLPPWEEENR
ncbi:polysulfide reductase [candidate division WOR-1 bacterium RIFCSPHIGHO2_01_FULL_53_15]|uniref:Polysulfide reductase n=1 Tax=candidate division WOR-1 bacterium RIFCSPHIGHO2_01_FULL_53_15 TaxID=1802564 RepID=A0A1F4Q3M0_UNCSA|nr:MAG: polysulfide reductase [candidate division WOR-1 bacterium RIFCSPHIGHO2_01_FULL_53_15]OGC12666.1 MAG: polysulfide reductase [candidate division WOR-1 bacterium RIFCSPHIGHO2_02_FULL_53_26]